MTEEDYLLFCDVQDGRCAICGKKRKLCVDHCHDTGRIRGLLCRHCNMALGLLGDNLAGVEAAAEYLRTF